MVFLLAVSAYAATAAEQPAPEIVCDQPVFDFREADNNQTIEHTFVLWNRGNAPLEIQRVSACCGATTKLGAQLVPPGTNTTLDIKYSLNGRRGALKKSIHIQSNDPKHPMYALTLTGAAVAQLDVEPRTVYFGPISSDAVLEKEARIVANTNITFRITNVTATAAQFAVTYEAVEANTYLLKIRTVPPLPFGVTHAQIHVFSDNAQFPCFYIPVIASVSSDIIVAPREIQLPIPETDDATNRVSCSLLISSRSKTAFKILQVMSPDEDIKVEYAGLTPAKYRLTVSNIASSAKLDGTSIVITTDHEHAEKISIPIRVASGNGGITEHRPAEGSGKAASGALDEAVHGNAATTQAAPASAQELGMEGGTPLPPVSDATARIPPGAGTDLTVRAPSAPATISALDDIALVPREICLTQATGMPEPVTSYALLRSRTRMPFKILKIETPKSEDIEITYETFAFGQYRLKISNILPTVALDGKSIVITTDHEGNGKLEIPIRVVSK